jgi:hypothetical protein
LADPDVNPMRRMHMVPKIMNPSFYMVVNQVAASVSVNTR